MKKIKMCMRYFNKEEKALWTVSVLLIMISFFVFDRTNYLTLAASVIGETALIFCAKGNPVGQFLMIIFSILYGIISYDFAYYGEMITYVGMTGPMAVISLISWLKHPYKENRSEVKINKIPGKEWILIFILASVVTYIFYFILKYFNTANLLPSTVSVTTSFIAVYLTFRRSAFYALGYALNDLVLIILWTMAAFTDISYISVLICFAAFFINDLYGFANWSRMQKRQT